MLFRSTQPDIPLPTDVTIWDWLFDSPYSSLENYSSPALRGYRNGITGDRIDYAQVQEATTNLSTALVKRYGLKEGDAVVLFSPKNIWYLVAMLGTLRAVRTICGVFSAASPAYNIEEMTYALKKVDAKFLVTVPSSIDVATAAAKNARISRKRVYLLEEELKGFTTMKTLLDIGKSFGEADQTPSFKIPEGKKNRDVCAVLSFSSGSSERDSAHPPEKYDYKYGHTVGTICASTEIKVTDFDGNELGLNEPGDILTRGPQITMGCLDYPKATAETFDKDGWLHTGDQGIIDDEGVGVAPAELDDLLLGHPDVEDVALMSVPDDYTRERPKAFVVPKNGVEASQEFTQKLSKCARKEVED